ncbi:MAG: ferredoxin family protein [Desulfitobacteriaceae bacterium]
MSIKISQQTCMGCGKCLDVCPGDLIQRDEAGKSYLKYPQDCWGCTSCLKECASGAIKYYLGADIGGLGGYLYTQKDKDRLHWYIRKADGEQVKVTINPKEANQY